MEEVKFSEYREMLLNILVDVDDFCQTNNIAYYLDSGTLIGAVRHKGFIPWDDDIDLVMPREDYEVFVDKYVSDSCYVLTNREYPDYYYQFAKVVQRHTKLVETGVPIIDRLGVNIDIFPIDGLPNKKLFRRYHQDKLFFLNKFRTLVILISNLLGKREPFESIWCYLIRVIEKNGKKYSMNSSKYCGNIVATTIRHRESKSDCFKSQVYLFFEGKEFSAPSGYKEYLNDMFGDYLKLPPLDQQVSNHNYKAYKCRSGGNT